MEPAASQDSIHHRPSRSLHVYLIILDAARGLLTRVLRVLEICLRLRCFSSRLKRESSLYMQHVATRANPFGARVRLHLSFFFTSGSFCYIFFLFFHLVPPSRARSFVLRQRKHIDSPVTSAEGVIETQKEREVESHFFLSYRAIWTLPFRHDI